MSVVFKKRKRPGGSNLPDHSAVSGVNSNDISEEKEEKEKPTRRFRVKSNDGGDEDDSSEDAEIVVKSSAKVLQSKASGALVFSSKSVADSGSAEVESSKSFSVLYDSSKEILPVKYSGDTATAEIDGGGRSGADGYNNNAQIALPEHAKSKLGKGSTMAIGPMKAPSFLRATSRFVSAPLYISNQPSHVTYILFCRTINLTFAKTTKKLDFVAMAITASSCMIEETIRAAGRWRGFHFST